MQDHSNLPLFCIALCEVQDREEYKQEKKMGDGKGKCWADYKNYPSNFLNESNLWLWAAEVASRWDFWVENSSY